MRGADALPGSKATSRAKGSHRNLGGLGSGRQMLRERDGPHREGEEPKPMMHGHEKSDLVIVAVKPTNKARKAPCGGVCRGGRSGVGGAKGGGQGEYAPAKHVLDSEPGSRVTGAGAYTATCAVTHPRQEPYAGKPHVRIWAGACHEMHVPTATAARVIRLIFKPVKSALLALKVSGAVPARHFGVLVCSAAPAALQKLAHGPHCDPAHRSVAKLHATQVVGQHSR